MHYVDPFVILVRFMYFEDVGVVDLRQNFDLVEDLILIVLTNQILVNYSDASLALRAIVLARSNFAMLTCSK